VLRDDQLVASALIPSRIDPEKTAREVLGLACDEAEGLGGPDELAYVVGTGYGRNEVPFADENVSELSCHALGAHHCDSTIRTLIDIGGQDVKAIALHDDGSVREFAMNDKRAAGTGRFFEAMARIFQIDLSAFAELSVGATDLVPVTSQCSVFAETEVISLISQRVPPEHIAAGVQAAVAKRVFSLARRVGVAPALTVTGGCAHNRGLRKRLEQVLRLPVVPLSIDPQLMGALGAALLAARRGRSGPP
jgi:predicted CoA-substrate-specific enzyme activase